MLQERCTAVDTMSFVARVLHRSKPHLQSMLLQNNPAIVEDFFVNLVRISVAAQLVVWTKCIAEKLRQMCQQEPL